MTVTRTIKITAIFKSHTLRLDSENYQRNHNQSQSKTHKRIYNSFGLTSHPSPKNSPRDRLYILVILKKATLDLFIVVYLILYSFFADSDPKSPFTLLWIKNTEFIQKED